ncbi:MAG: hypothetical protein MK212_13105, partial [Saprospiraceae bacterium]|nr:hypothetical protein [Saprospiraceae bacterium]
MKVIHLSLMVFFAFFLSGSTLFAQNANDYAPQWKTIDSLQGIGRPKSALEKTEALYERIKKDVKNSKQNAQIVKAIIYINKYQSQLEEEGLVKAIGRF